MKVEPGDFVLWIHGSLYLGAVVDSIGSNGIVFVDRERWGPRFGVKPAFVTSKEVGDEIMKQLDRAEERAQTIIECAKALFEAERDAIIKVFCARGDLR